MTVVVESAAPAVPAAPTFHGFDHIRWWVGNARHTAAFFVNGFGFTVVAYAGPETGSSDTVSYVLAQGDIQFVVTSGLDGVSDVTRHVLRHGDGVRAVALRVDDSRAAFDALVARGAVASARRRRSKATTGASRFPRSRPTATPCTRSSSAARTAARSLPVSKSPTRLPTTGPRSGSRASTTSSATSDGARSRRGWSSTSACSGSGRSPTSMPTRSRPSSPPSQSTVVWDGDRVVMPINEPADGRRRSQIQEYLDYYGSPGVQHLALRTDDIVATVTALQQRGIQCLDVPPTYYADVRERLGDLDLPWDELERLGILVDRDHDGYLLQIFTENVASRPTVFIEIIQRFGARGFGEGNFKALFEAIERAGAPRQPLIVADDPAVRAYVRLLNTDIGAVRWGRRERCTRRPAISRCRRSTSSSGCTPDTYSGSPTSSRVANRPPNTSCRTSSCASPTPAPSSIPRRTCAAASSTRRGLGTAVAG